ncbi:hypothetical protein Ahy_A09g043569 [Arachis hypogaea]|uniref:BED-type domain-containing protein n=1 Tax=Arachis hypogaea TaxID=3818 RepID=A0A445BIM9_ARAHY|nr:hypothetical protein Ahy_A09g043569 [Arachis hypogaea]
MAGNFPCEDGDGGQNSPEAVISPSNIYIYRKFGNPSPSFLTLVPLPASQLPSHPHPPREDANPPSAFSPSSLHPASHLRTPPSRPHHCLFQPAHSPRHHRTSPFPSFFANVAAPLSLFNSYAAAVLHCYIASLLFFSPASVTSSAISPLSLMDSFSSTPIENNNEIEPTQDDEEGGQEVSQEVQNSPNKKGLTSEAWKHFRREKIDGKWKEICKYCERKIGGDTKQGTKHLHDHIRICPIRTVRGPK